MSVKVFGYIVGLVERLDFFFKNVSASRCSLRVFQRPILLSAHVVIFQAAQSDLCRQLKRNVGAVQSKATVRAARGGNRTRLGCGHTPRSKVGDIFIALGDFAAVSASFLFPSNSLIDLNV